MKKSGALFSILLTMSVIAGTPVTAYANHADPLIADRLDTFRRKTCCDSVSTAVIRAGETEVYGDVDGLYLIGSMTKAFTGLAIQKLLLEGRLDENDSVSELLPGFTACYDSVPCEITIHQLLTQTSGYTNKEKDYPSAAADMSLMDWVGSMSGRELASSPGTEYAYSNVNYNLLGAVIEQVSGKSYAEYMATEILLPLGLDNTYAGMPPDGERILPGGRLGYRHSFRYELPVMEGRIPAGYLYSNAADMTRWMRIWTGTTDIPQEFSEMIRAVKAHLQKPGDYYAGWELFEDGLIGHSGGTPNYSSRIVFSDEKQIGVCVLTNLNVAASTDDLCNGIFMITAGESAGRLQADVWTVFDIIFSLVSVIGILLILSAIWMHRRWSLIVSAIAVMSLLIAVCIIMPSIFGAGLGEILFTWAPYSFGGGLLIWAIYLPVAGIRLWKLKNHEN